MARLRGAWNPWKIDNRSMDNPYEHGLVHSFTGGPEEWIKKGKYRSYNTSRSKKERYTRKKIHIEPDVRREVTKTRCDITKVFTVWVRGGIGSGSQSLKPKFDLDITCFSFTRLSSKPIAVRHDKSRSQWRKVQSFTYSCQWDTYPNLWALIGSFMKSDLLLPGFFFQGKKTFLHFL